MNVWCGIINDMLIGPVTVEDQMTGDSYLHFLQHELPEQLEDFPLDTVTCTYSTMDHQSITPGR